MRSTGNETLPRNGDSSMRRGVHIDGHSLELGNEGVYDCLPGRFELRPQSFSPPQSLERRGFFSGPTGLVSADDAHVGTEGFVPCTVMERAGAIDHEGNQENRPRERSEFGVTDMSHHAILRDCAAGVKRGSQ